MHEKNKITGLLEKILTNQAGREEKKKLFQLINQERDKDYIYAWLKEIWNEVEYENLDISSKTILDKIHNQIKDKKSLEHKPIKRKSKIRKIIQATLKYAAVCLIACGIEWVVLTQDIHFFEKNITELNYNEITVPMGSKSYIVLSDSTKVWLNAGTTFKYPSNFQKNSREVFLEGEAFFDVSKNKKKPFYVDVAEMDIKVLGTKFNVKAYTDENNIETTLEEGVIEVVGLKSDTEEGKNLCLNPGQKLILTKEMTSQQTAGDPSVKIKNAKLITLQNTKLETAWTEGKLIFYKEPFEGVKVKLERWYGVTIDIQNPEILDYRFTGTFDEETLEQALEALKKAARFDYQIKKKHVTITKR